MDYRGYGIDISSWDDDTQLCYLNVRWNTWHKVIPLPRWLLQPHKEKVYANWDEATVQRLGRNWYWDIERCVYGFSIYETLFSIYYGRRSNSSITDCHKGWFIPWLEYRFHRLSFYTPDHVHVRTFDYGYQWPNTESEVETLPKEVLVFNDYDGTEIEVTCYIEEREWRRGTDWFKWLHWFYDPIIRRSVDLSFSKETGRGKHDWKGGTIGTSTNIDPNESIFDAFCRYAKEHKFTDVRRK